MSGIQAMVDMLSLRSSPGTVRKYVSAVSTYLGSTKGAGGNPDRVRGYLLRLRDTGRGDSTIRIAYYSIWAYWRANGWKWDPEAIPLPRSLSEREEGPPRVFPPEEMEGIVLTCRAAFQGEGNTYALSRDMIGRLMLGIAFGFRVAEIAQVGRNSFRDGLLEVTVKGGKKRRHRLPEELRWIEDACVLPMSHRTANNVLRRAMVSAGLDLTGWEGLKWHAIRSAVETALEERIGQGLLMLDIPLFFGWSTLPAIDSSGTKMMLRYARPDMRELERRVFSCNPYLTLWREGPKKEATID